MYLWRLCLSLGLGDEGILCLYSFVSLIKHPILFIAVLNWRLRTYRRLGIEESKVAET